MLAMVTLAGCGKEGPMGPKGDTGATGGQGSPGSVQSFVLYVDPTNNNQATRFLLTCVKSYTLGGLTAVSSVVNVYAKIPSISEDWIALPLSFRESDGTLSNVYFSVAPGQVVVNTINASRPTSGFQVYITVVN